MDWKFYIGILAGVIAFFAYILYVRSIIRGETKPNKATWWIWAFMGAVVGLSYYFSGAENTIWVPIVEFLGPFLIALLSIRYGEGGFDNKTDIMCFIGALLSIILWIIFKNPVIALVTNLLIDSFALIPTIRKSYLRPEGENFSAWLGTVFADGLNLFAVEKFTFAILIYPIYMFVSDLIILLILFFKKNKNV